MHHPETLRYTPSHEWVRVEGDLATVGITDHAQHELGDVVYLDLPDVGRTFERGAAFGVVESVKAASDIYAPVSGEVVQRNDELLGAPEGVNNSPYGTGWMIVLRMSRPDEVGSLLEASDYLATLE
jgi:glycine cleavage system H protein